MFLAVSSAITVVLFLGFHGMPEITLEYTDSVTVGLSISHASSFEPHLLQNLRHSRNYMSCIVRSSPILTASHRIPDSCRIKGLATSDTEVCPRSICLTAYRTFQCVNQISTAFTVECFTYVLFSTLRACNGRALFIHVGRKLRLSSGFELWIGWSCCEIFQDAL